MRRRRKRHFLYIGGRDDLIATNAILLNIKHKFYGFSGDLIETINYLIYQCGKVVLSRFLQASLLCVKYSR